MIPLFWHSHLHSPHKELPYNIICHYLCISHLSRVTHRLILTLIIFHKPYFRTHTIHSSTQIGSVHLVYISSLTSRQSNLTSNSFPQNIQGTIIEGMSWVVIVTATHPKEAQFNKDTKQCCMLV